MGRILTILVVFAFAPLSAVANVVEATKILEFYRTEDLLKEAIPCMEQHLNKMAKDLNIDAGRKKKLQSLIKRIYPAKNLYKIFKETFAANYTPEKVERKKKFVNSTEGIKLRQAYKLTFAAGSGGLANYYKQNSGQLLTPNRKNSIMTFITSAEQDRTHAIMQSRCYLGIQLASNSWKAQSDRQSIRQLKETMETREGSYIEAARKNLEQFNFYLLRDHSTTEIDSLSLYYSSADGQPFTKAYKKALTVAMESAANTLYSVILNPEKSASKK